VDPANHAIDSFSSTEGITINKENSSFNLSGLRLLSKPTEPSYEFTVLAFDTPTTYPKIVIDKDLTVISYKMDGLDNQAKALPADFNITDSTYQADGVTQYPVTQTSDGTSAINIDGEVYFLYGSDKAGQGKILLTKVTTDLDGESTSIHDNVIDDMSNAINDTIFNGDTPVDINDPNFTEGGTNFDQQTTNSGQKSTGARTSTDTKVVRFDQKAYNIEGYSTYFRPTLFMNISRSRTASYFTKSSQNGLMMGYKASIVDKNMSVELLGGYGFIDTDTVNNAATHNTTIASHSLTVSTKTSYSFELAKHLKLVPALYADYSFVNTPTAKATDSSLKLKSLHKIDTIPSIGLASNIDGWNIAATFKYHCRFGGATKATVNGKKVINADVIKKKYAEYSLNITKQFGNVNLDLKLSKTTGSAKAVKGSFQVSTRF
jgi:hypothetical protein